MSEYKMIEFFSGSEILSDTAEEYGFETLTIDVEEKYDPDLVIDIEDMTIEDIPQDFRDVIYAHGSPPCTTVSPGSFSKFWNKIDGIYEVVKDERGLPTKKGRRALKHIRLVGKFIDMIRSLNPTYWTMENPRNGLMSNIMDQYGLPQPIGWVSYCQYGEDRMKPTHIWGDLPDGFDFKNCHYGADCHVSAPRGSSKGTQGLKNSFERAKLPKALCEKIIENIIQNSFTNSNNFQKEAE